MIIRKPGEIGRAVRRSAGRHARTPERRAARTAAADKSMAVYVRLDCGHLTTRETIEAYAVFQPGRGRYWCENCHCWRGKAADPVAPELPDNPPF